MVGAVSQSSSPGDPADSQTRTREGDTRSRMGAWVHNEVASFGGSCRVKCLRDRAQLQLSILT